MAREGRSFRDVPVVSVVMAVVVMACVCVCVSGGGGEGGKCWRGEEQKRARKTEFGGAGQRNELLDQIHVQ